MLLVAMPGATNSILAPSSDALCSWCALKTPTLKVKTELMAARTLQRPGRVDVSVVAGVRVHLFLLWFVSPVVWRHQMAQMKLSIYPKLRSRWRCSSLGVRSFSTLNRDHLHMFIERSSGKVFRCSNSLGVSHTHETNISKW